MGGRKFSHFSLSGFVTYRVKISQASFADDVALTAESERELKENFNVRNSVLEKKDVEINESKTKVMIIRVTG